MVALLLLEYSCTEKQEVTCLKSQGDFSDVNERKTDATIEEVF